MTETQRCFDEVGTNPAIGIIVDLRDVAIVSEREGAGLPSLHHFRKYR